MIEQTTSQNAHKKGLQRQIRQTRDSLRDTVEQIQDTAEQKYEAVSDVLDYREEFQKEPVVWTVGALSAGFAAGYAVGYSHKLTQNKKGSQFANFADTVVTDLSRLGQRLVLPELNAKITELFGFNFGGFLQEIGGNGKHSRTRRLQSRRRQKQPKGGRRKKSS